VKDRFESSERYVCRRDVIGYEDIDDTVVRGARRRSMGHGLIPKMAPSRAADWAQFSQTTIGEYVAPVGLDWVDRDEPWGLRHSTWALGPEAKGLSGGLGLGRPIPVGWALCRAAGI